MLNKLKSFMTTRCPVCRHRLGVRARRSTIEDRVLGALSIYPFECRGCNHRFRALRHVRVEKKSLRLTILLAVMLLPALVSAESGGNGPAGQPAPPAAQEASQPVAEDQAAQDIPLSPPQGPSIIVPQEILAMLDQRKRALDKKEEELRVTEGRLMTLKTEIEDILTRHEQSLKLAEKIRKSAEEEKAALTQKQAKVDTETRKADQTRIAKMYETMPAEEAAARIEKMPQARALELLRLLKGKSAGAILAQVQATKAAKLTEQLIPKP